MILGVGTDLVSIERIARAVGRSERFTRRVYHPQELKETRDRPENLAVRFAAKEAWLKAMSLPLFSVPLVDVFVTYMPSGQPQIEVRGKAKEAMQNKGVAKVHLSMSHDREYALAVVVLEGETQ